MRDRRTVDERLEGRAGLALGLCDAVEFALEVVVAADQRQDVAGSDLEREERALHLGLLIEGEALRRGRLRRDVVRKRGELVRLVGLVGFVGCGFDACLLCLRVFALVGRALRCSGALDDTELCDVAHAEDLLDVLPGQQPAGRVGFAGPADVRQLDATARPGAKRHTREVRLLVHLRYDAFQHAADDELFDDAQLGQLDLVRERQPLDLEVQRVGRYPLHLAAVALARVVIFDPLLYRGHGGALQLEIQGGADRQAAGQNEFAAESFEQVAANLFGEVGRGRVVLPGLPCLVDVDDRGLGERLLVALAVDDVVGEHAPEHVSAAPLGGFGPAEGRVI